MTDPQPSPPDSDQPLDRQSSRDAEPFRDAELSGDGEPVWTWLAEIRRPQGRKGEVLATVLTDFPEKFSQRRHLWLLHPASSASSHAAPRPVELTGFWMHKGSVVLHFAGTDSISDAEALRGLIVAIPRSERAALDADAWYIGDLIGCAVFDIRASAADLIGTIEDVDRTAGPVALLVVRPAVGIAAPGDELLIPLANSYLRRVDLAARRIEMALPEGLLDLNAPAPRRAPVHPEADHA